METEDLKNSLEQQLESYKQRLNNQVTKFLILRDTLLDLRELALI